MKYGYIGVVGPSSRDPIAYDSRRVRNRNFKFRILFHLASVTERDGYILKKIIAISFRMFVLITKIYCNFCPFFLCK